VDGKPLSSQGPLGRNEARFASRWILAAISARALIGLRPPLGVFQEVRDQAPSQQVEVALAGLRMPAHDHRILAARDSRDLLAPVYGWFTEGFDNPVLQDAKALLDELTGTIDSAAISNCAADPSSG